MTDILAHCEEEWQAGWPDVVGLGLVLLFFLGLVLIMARD